MDFRLTIDDFQKVSNRIPYFADLKPSCIYLMEDLHNAGRTPAVMKYLLSKGLLNGNCITVTGKILSENLHPLPGLTEGQAVIHILDHPIKEMRVNPFVSF